MCSEHQVPKEWRATTFEYDDEGITVRIDTDNTRHEQAPLVAGGPVLFADLLAPLVNVRTTLLFFATLILHHHLFGADHAISRLMGLDPVVPVVVYTYGALVLVANLITVSEDWDPLLSWLVWIGDVVVSVAFTALFYLSPSTPTWSEVLAQLIYAAQGVLALALVVLSLMGDRWGRLGVNPRLEPAPGPLWSLGILVYVGGMTLLLRYSFGIAPYAVTDKVTLLGVVLLAVRRHFTRQAEGG
jgi:hypothetical protein